MIKKIDQIPKRLLQRKWIRQVILYICVAAALSTVVLSTLFCFGITVSPIIIGMCKDFYFFGLLMALGYLIAKNVFCSWTKRFWFIHFLYFMMYVFEKYILTLLFLTELSKEAHIGLNIVMIIIAIFGVHDLIINKFKILKI